MKCKVAPDNLPSCFDRLNIFLSAKYFLGEKSANSKYFDSFNFLDSKLAETVILRIAVISIINA